MKHTPAPWRVDYGRDCAGIIAPKENSDKHQVVGVNAIQGENYEANAKLIAAAPELLAACQGALEAIDRYPDRGHPMTASEIIMRNAVAKATK